MDDTFQNKSNEAIIQAYQNQRQKSKKARHHCTLEDPKRMISEHIRIFLSQYVRQTNKLKGRKGTLVFERFQKYILNKQADYKKIFEFITNQTRIPEQKNKRYRADEKHYDLLKEVNSNGLLRVGNKIYSRVCKVEEGYLKCMRLIRPNDPVLRNFLQISNNSKFTQNSS